MVRNREVAHWYLGLHGGQVTDVKATI